MTPTHVICPKVDGLPEYLTAGKRYECENGLAPGSLVIVGDHDLRITIWQNRCPHLNGADWIPVYMDGCPTCGGTGEVYADVPTPTMRCPDCTQPNWNDLGPRMLEALRRLADASEHYLDSSDHYFSDSDFDRDGGLADSQAELKVVAMPKARAIIKEAEER